MSFRRAIAGRQCDEANGLAAAGRESKRQAVGARDRALLDDDFGRRRLPGCPADKGVAAPAQGMRRRRLGHPSEAVQVEGCSTARPRRSRQRRIGSDERERVIVVPYLFWIEMTARCTGSLPGPSFTCSWLGDTETSKRRVESSKVNAAVEPTRATTVGRRFA
jgi:hypothetical protein